MGARISQLEKALSQENDQESRNATARIAIESSPCRDEETAKSGQTARGVPKDVLVQHDSTSQYFNEVFLSGVIREERPLEPEPFKASQIRLVDQTMSPFDASGILSSPCLTQHPGEFHPTKAIAMALWNTYVQNVECCLGLKMLHLSTDEVRVYSVINSPNDASFEDLSLCYAVYFAAAISLQDVDAHAILGGEKNSSLLMFKFALEQALAQGGFLDRPTITYLHALAVFLSALRIRNHSKGIWILNGLAIRIAESLGLNRDGENLGVSPFHSEIRRRLWWHLLSRDGRSGEEYGLENMNGSFLTSEVRTPLNIDDTDLQPDMDELPKPKKFWTAMTFSLINLELIKAQQRLTGIARSSSHSSPPREVVRREIMEDTRAQIDDLLQGCSPVIPQQRLTLHCSQWLLRKLDFISRQQWMVLQHSGALRQDLATEENLIDALELLEPRLANEDELIQQFAWARTAYPQYHIPMYILWHLCVKPEGPSIARAWAAMDLLFSSPLWDDYTSCFRTKAPILAALRTKAMLACGKSQNIHSGNVTGSAATGSEGSTSQHPHAFPAPASGAFGDLGNVELHFDISDNDWLDWTAVLQDM